MKMILVLAAMALAVDASSTGSQNTYSRPWPRLAGVQCKDNGGFRTYYGIRFGTAKRWEAPVEVPLPLHVNGTKPGPGCPQAETWFGKVHDQSEDCLNLNIVAPKKKPSKPLPVRVIIPGGAFVTASNNLLFESCKAAADSKSIIVTINYRVNAFGFLAHKALATSDAPAGNYGFLDQRLALKWVKKNIAVFGGDPSKIGIYGESAGGTSVWMHIVSPGSKGLFNTAIVSSGAPFKMNNITTANQKGDLFAEKLNCTGSEVVKCLKGKSVQEVLDAAPAASENNGGLGYSYLPVVDGKNFPAQPMALIESGRFNKVPVISGTNANETLFYLETSRGTANDLTNIPESWYMVEGYIMGKGASPAQLGQLLSLYNTSFPPSPYFSPTSQRLSAIMTDEIHACIHRRALRALRKYGVPAYAYYDNQVPTCPMVPGLLPDGDPAALGVSHSFDLAYVFPLDKWPVDGKQCWVPSGEKRLGRSVGKAFTNFVKTGSPSFDDLSWPMFPVYVEWKAGGGPDKMGLIPYQTGGMNDYYNERCAIWDDLQKDITQI